MLPKTGLYYTKLWHLIDAKNQVLGRMATQIATLLMGKNKPIYHPSADCGDYVVLINAKHIHVTGKKREQKQYFHHTGWPGGLVVREFEKVQEKDPGEIIKKAVAGMLPKNKLRKQRMERLKIFPTEQYPLKENVRPFLLKRYKNKDSFGTLMETFVKTSSLKAVE